MIEQNIKELNRSTCENQSILQWANWCEGEESWLDGDDEND